MEEGCLDTTYYLNDGLSVLNELDSAGNAAKTIVRGIEQIAEIDRAGNITYVHQDVLGSAVLLTNQAGEAVKEYEYDPFGQFIGTSGLTETKYLFTGQELDLESELYYYNARYHNPRLGRFISRDPLLGSDGNALSRNGYIYVKNNPLKYVDPSGEYDIDFHYYAIYALGRFAGLSDTIANRMATFSQYTDVNEKTEPWRTGSVNRGIFHFFGTSYGGETKRNPISIKNDIMEALENRDYIKTGMLLHIYADSWAHEGNGSEIGHLYAGTRPDESFRAIGKALEASLEIFKLLRASPDAAADSQTDFLGFKEVLSKEGGKLYGGLMDKEEGRVENWKNYFAKKNWKAIFSADISDDDKTKFGAKAEEIREKYLTIMTGSCGANRLGIQPCR